jgi:polysaccharide biosynthesis transport protein
MLVLEDSAVTARERSGFPLINAQVVAPDNYDTVMDLKGLLGIVRRRLLLIILVVSTVLVGVALVTWRTTPIYQATSRVEVLPSSISSTGQVTLENLVDPRSALQTQVELIKGEVVLGAAAEELGLPESSALTRGLSVQLLEGTQIVEIRVENPNPEEAKEFANTIASSYIEFRRNRANQTSLAASETITRQMQEIRNRISEIEASGQAEVAGTPEKIERDRLFAQLGSLEGQLLVLPDAEALRQGGGTVVSEAGTPEAPIRPRRAVNMSIAVILGLFLGIGAALLAETLDDRIKGSDEVERLLGVPVLGHIPIVDKWADQGVASLAIESETSSGAAEAYRTLRTNLRFVSLDQPIRSLLITSSTAGAGKTTTAANLAAVMAQGGSKTILVAGDLRKPAAHRMFDLSNKGGIVQALDTDTPLPELLQRHDHTNLRLLASGGTPPNPTEVLASARFKELLDQLTSASEMVIVDSPPILGLGDVSALAARVDGVLMVVNAGSVTKKELVDGADQVRKAGGKIIGCVLNAVDAKDGYGYYYQHYYADYVKEAPSPNGVAAGEPADDISAGKADRDGEPESDVQPTATPPEEVR